MSIDIGRFIKNGYIKFCGWTLILFILYKIIESQIFIDLLVKMFGEFGAVVYSFSFFGACVLFTILLVVATSWLYRIMDTAIDKTTSEYNDNLYYWLGDDSISETFLKKFFSQKASSDYDVIKNLKIIRKKITDSFKDEVIDYKIFRRYLYKKSKKSLFNKINIYILSLFSTAVTMYFMPKFVDYLIEKVGEHDIFKILEDFSGYQIYSYLIIFISIAFVAYFLVYQVLLNFTVRSRRINFLIEILDIIIEEKEK